MSTPSQLLAAGKSFMGVREAPRPLHLVSQDYLPHFQDAAPKLANASAAGEALGPLFIPAYDQAAAVDLRRGCEAAPRASGADCRGLSARREGAAREVRAVPTRPRATESWWDPAQLLRRLLWSGSLRLKAPARGPRAGKQGELSLATIRVKRNDLVDADIELVRVRGGTRPAERAVGAPRPGEGTRAPTPGGSWGLASWRRWWEGRLKMAR